MKYRILGGTRYGISEVSFGAWAIGGSWGTVDDDTSFRTLKKAVEMGINFFDTADVYGDGRSEQLIGKLLKSVDHRIYVATKAGRRSNPHVSASYTKENLTKYVDRSLKNLGVECLDLLQLHCPPTDVYDNDAVFDALDDLKKQGKIAHYGVSVEKVDEALRAIERPNVDTVQII